jgi:hypothetical protein
VEDGQGRFEVRGLEAGSYEIEAIAPDGRVGRAGPVAVAAGGVVEGVRVQVAESARMLVQAVEHDTGRPAAGVEVRLTDAGHTLASGRTDGEGRLELRGLAPGARGDLMLPTGMGPFPYAIESVPVTVPGGPAQAPMVVRLLRVRPDDWMRLSDAAGVGLRLASAAGRVVVEEVVPGRPAAAAGVVPGEVVLAVDGKDVRGLGPGSVSYLVRGPAGSEVRLDLVGPRGQRALTMVRVARPDRTPASPR